jgi:uncharacterized damage-inducible protein DinB
MKISEVRSDFKQSTRQLLNTISNFPEEYFNTQPEEGKWTAGQIAEHLIKVETGTVRLFTGDTEACDRDPKEKIATVKERMLNYDSKMNADGPIIPDDNPKGKDRVLEKLQDIRQRLISMVEIEDLTELVSGFDHPLFGPMTRVEWIYFNIYHGRRHLHQIQDLERILSKK